MTPLMSAAQKASNETITCLLSWRASPDKTNAYGHTALIFGIHSKCSTTINLLAPVTKVNLGETLEWLAKDKVPMTEDVPYDPYDELFTVTGYDLPAFGNEVYDSEKSSYNIVRY